MCSFSYIVFQLDSDDDDDNDDDELLLVAAFSSSDLGLLRPITLEQSVVWCVSVILVLFGRGS